MMFIAFRVKRGRDNDLISWLDSLNEGDRSYHIREALRRGYSLQGTAAPVYPTIKIQSKEVDNKEPVISEADLETALDAWFS